MASIPNTTSITWSPSSNSPLELAIKRFSTGIEEKEGLNNPFYKELISQTQQKEQTSHAQAQSQTSATDLIMFVESMRLKTRFSRPVNFMRKAQTFIENLKSLMALCEKALQAAPFGVSIAFTGARVVLELAAKLNYLDEVLDGMVGIGTVIKGYEKFAYAFETSLDVQNVLVASYERILKFWYEVSAILSSRKAKFLKPLLSTLDKEILNALNGLREDRRNVMFLAAGTGEEKKKQENIEAERKAVLKWIKSDSQLDVRVYLKDQSALHMEDTCQWILEDSRFQDWSKSKENTVLWYTANPGSGKSVLAATVVQYLRNQGKKVVHFFYSFNDPARKWCISGLRSLALQLSGFLKSLPDTLLDRYTEECSNHQEDLQNPHLAALVVHDLLLCDEVYIVVDGVDECSDEEVLLREFGLLTKKKTNSTVRWMFTSRDSHSIRCMMQESKAVEIKAEADVIAEDIHKYFLARHPDHKDVIRKWKESEDNFLYAKLICDTMAGEGLTSVADIEEALDGYPKDLNGYYMRALVKLSAKKEREQHVARRTFLVLIGAAQSITLNELLDLLAVTPGRDYDEKRRPAGKVVKELCSPLLVYCAPKDGDEPDNPRLALCHKTVEDFLTQNPNAISPDTGITPELHQYFVPPLIANERLGLDCLTYLSYTRYQSPNLEIDPILSKPIAKEHAFLPYAATFWALHLSAVCQPGLQIQQAVQKFLKCPAFWTCLSVQARVSPYLFGRYSCSRNGIFFSMGIKSKLQSSEDQVGLPLPIWLDSSKDGRDLEFSLCSFAEEWREILLTCPNGLDSCPQLMQRQISCHLTPLRPVKTVRVAYLGDNLHAVRLMEQPSILNVSFRGKTLWVTFVSFNKGGKLARLKVPLFSKTKSPELDEQWIPVDPMQTADWNASEWRVDEISDEVQAWNVDSNTLSVKRITGKISKEHKVRLAFSKKYAGRRNGRWVVSSNYNFMNHGRRRRSVQVIHMIWKFEKPASQLCRSSQLLAIGSENYDDSDNDSDDDSDDDSHEDDNGDEGEPETHELSDNASNSDASSNPTSSKSHESQNDTAWTSDTSNDDHGTRDGPFTDCLIVAPIDSEPSWHTWSNRRQIWSHINCASHPKLPLLVASYSARELAVFDLTKLNAKQIKHLPEIADLDEEPSASLRELQFSSCGDYIHFLSISFFANTVSTEARVTLSTFNFDPNGDSDRALIKEAQSCTCSYVFGETLKNTPLPFALTQWGDEEVIIALPPLTRDPKVLKVKLPQVSALTGQLACGNMESSIFTLREPVYFPTSTPGRKARLMYREAQGDDEACYIYLALDKCSSNSTNDGETAHPSLASDDAKTQSEEATSSAVCLRWKVKCRDGWRAWDPDSDNQASDLKRGLPVRKLLQGSFVDVDQRFCVSTRGGLNWKRKGFLTCAVV